MRVDLPEPGAEQRAHSARVAARIRDEIGKAGGALDFARYMELALYTPGLGYYSAGAAKFGAAGDFTTAPESGFVFARCLARALAPTLRATRARDLLELGPGSGALAAELLLELERLEALPQRYRLLERSADLRERQRVTLARRCAHLLDVCEWLDAPPAQSWRGALVANEVVDALPVRLFTLRDGGIFARAVAVDGDRFVWREVAADPALAEALARTLGAHARDLPRPYSSEICTLLPAWFAEVTSTLVEGDAWFIDYGYDRATYYAPARRDGTLRCHYRHRAHNAPLILPGLQDITAWVDFDALIEAGGACGFKTSAPVAQSRFLIEHGVEEVFAQAYSQAPDEAARYRLAQEVKRLTLPSEMGESFKVALLQR